MTDPFEQLVKQSDKEQAENIKLNRDIIHSALCLLKDTTKLGAVLVYLSLRMVFGGGSKVCTIVFQEILKIYDKDDELHNTYYKGVEDASKMMPHKHYDDIKKKCAYEEGKKNGVF